MLVFRSCRVRSDLLRIIVDEDDEVRCSSKGLMWHQSVNVHMDKSRGLHPLGVQVKWGMEVCLPFLTMLDELVVGEGEFWYVSNLG